MSLDSLVWTPHSSFHRRIQDEKISESLLDDHFDWLLYGTTKFMPRNDASRRHILENHTLDVKGKSLPYDNKMRHLVIRVAKLLDVDEVQVMLLVVRWFKLPECTVKLEDVSENDPADINEILLQILRYYHEERIILIKCIQVVMLKADDGREFSSVISHFRDRLIDANLEEQLHARLRENLEVGHATITQRLKACCSDTAAAAGGAGAAAGAASVVTSPGFSGGIAENLSWLVTANSEMRMQLISERLELLNCLLLLYEICGVECKPDRTQALARLLLYRVFPSVQTGTGGAGGGALGSDETTVMSQQLAALLLMSCLNLQGHIHLTASPSGVRTAPVLETELPLGGKTIDVHNQISQYAATPATALLQLTWTACLQLVDISGAGHIIRDLETVMRELDARVGAIGGLSAAVVALASLCNSAVGAFLMVCRSVAMKALCVLCTAFDLGVDALTSDMNEAVFSLVKLCIEGNAMACIRVWDVSLVTYAPLRSLLAAAARLYPTAPHYLLRLLRLTVASPETAYAAYDFLTHVSMASAAEPAVRQLGGWTSGHVELTAASPQLLFLLGRASHCVASLEHALLHSLPLEENILRELADGLSLLAGLCTHCPSLMDELLQHRVSFSPEATRGWADVVAGVLDIGPQLATRLVAAPVAAANVSAGTRIGSADEMLPPPLRLLADAAELLRAVAERAPRRVLALLQQLPLLLSPSGDMLSGLPPGVRLDSLLSFKVPSTISTFCGLLPAWSTMQRDLERPAGKYPLTVALLSLSVRLLERGFMEAPLSTIVLFVLYEVLPNLHQWHYVSVKERWELTAISLRMLRLALTVGAYVSDPELTTLAAPPPPKVAIMVPARSGASGNPLLLAYDGGGNRSGIAAGVRASVAKEEEEEAVKLSADEILQASVPRLHVSVLSAALLKLMLLHGGILLARSLPPQVEELERLCNEDASRPELPYIEECAEELVQVIPPLLAAARVHPQEQPFEEFLFAGEKPTPAARIASYVAYKQVDCDEEEPERKINYLALRALLSIAACIARPVSRALPGVTLALAVPSGSPAESCMSALLHGDTAVANPLHHALVSHLAAEAVTNHPELLDALLFPSELEDAQFRQQSGREGVQSALGGAGAAGSVVPAKGARAWKALDGLYATLQRAAILKQDQPQVLASSLRVLAAMWRQPAAAHRAVSVLRSAPHMWSSLEACLKTVSATSGEAAGEFSRGSPHRDMCEAFAMQILTAEAFARVRFPVAVADCNGAHELLDRLVRNGGLTRLLRSAVEPSAGDTQGAVGGGEVGQLQSMAAVVTLTQGRKMWNGGEVHEGSSWSLELLEELAGVKSLLDKGTCSLEDVDIELEEMKSTFLFEVNPSSGPYDVDNSMRQLPPTHPLKLLLQHQCLGAVLASRCNVAVTDLAELPGGPVPPGLGLHHVLSTRRLLAILPEQTDSILVDCVAYFNTLSHLGEARLVQLQAACALISVLAQNGRLLPATSTDASGNGSIASVLLDPLPPPGVDVSTTPASEPSTSTAPASAATSGGGLLTSVQAVCSASVNRLLAWCASPNSRAALQQDWGLRRLHAERIAAALASARLLLSVFQSAQKILAASPPPPPAVGTGVASTPQTPVSVGNLFSTPIHLSPVATGPRSARLGNAAAAGSSTSSAGGSGGIAANRAYLPLVVSLTQQLAAWARVLTASGLPQCPPAAVAQITDGLAGALLLALQVLPAESTLPPMEQQLRAGDWQSLAASLQSTVPQLCDLAVSGCLSTCLAAQLLLESTRHLATHDWLPLLLSHLDFGQCILAAATRAAALATTVAGGDGTSATYPRGGAEAAAAAGDVGMLSLALVVAQIPDGARALHDRNVFEQLVAAGRLLLSGTGGRLAAFSVIAVTGTGPYRPRVDGTYASACNRYGVTPPDTCGAYLLEAVAAGAPNTAGEGQLWSPVHRQWCTLLQFSGALLKTLGTHTNMELEALDLLLAVEPRLMLAVLPPAGDVLQPLTLAGLVELEAALFLLGEMTNYIGGWHMVLPSSLLNFRTAVSTLLTWLAQPKLAKSFSVDCRPRTARETALAATPAPGIPSAEGWFRTCTHGATAGSLAAGRQGHPADFLAGGGGIGSPIAGSIATVGSVSRGMLEMLPTTPGPSGAVGLQTPITGAGGLSFGAATLSRSANAGLGFGSPSGGAAAGLQGAAGGNGSSGSGAMCSEYSAQMAEKIYLCTQHAVVFLLASSPQLNHGEAASLGPAWPRPRDLMAIMEHCGCASDSLNRAAINGDPPATHARRTHLCSLLARVGQLCLDFCSIVTSCT